MLLFYEVVTRAYKKAGPQLSGPGPGRPAAVAQSVCDRTGKRLCCHCASHEAERRSCRACRPRTTCSRRATFAFARCRRPWPATTTCWPNWCGIPSRRPRPTALWPDCERPGLAVKATRLVRSRECCNRRPRGRLLAGGFGPERCWSCQPARAIRPLPLSVFSAARAGLRPLDEPALEIDYSGRGDMLHWILWQAHRRLNERSGGPTSPAYFGGR